MKAAKINKGENTNKPTSDIVMSDDLFNIIKDTYLFNKAMTRDEIDSASKP